MNKKILRIGIVLLAIALLLSVVLVTVSALNNERDDHPWGGGSEAADNKNDFTEDPWSEDESAEHPWGSGHACFKSTIKPTSEFANIEDPWSEDE